MTHTAFAPLADIYPSGMPAEFVVFDPDLKCTQVELQAGRDESRLQRHHVWLDEYGLARATLSLEGQGVQTVRAISQVRGELGRTEVIVGNSRSSPLAVGVERCRYEAQENEVDLALIVSYGRQSFRGELELDLRSAERTVSSRVVQVEKGRAETRLRLPDESPYFLVLHTRITNKTTFLRLPEYEADDTHSHISLDVPEHLPPRQLMPLEISGGDGCGLLVIADARCTSGALCRSLTAGYEPLSAENLKHTNLRLDTGKLPAFIHRSRTQVPVCRAVSLGHFSAELRLPAPFNVRLWRVMLFVPDADRWRLVERIVDVGFAEGLSLDLPEYVAPGDEIQGIVAYGLAGCGGELFVDARSRERRKVADGETGELPVWVTGRDTAVRAVLQPTEGEKIDREWHNQVGSPAVKVHHVRFARAGEKFTDRTYTIFSSPESLARNMASRQLGDGYLNAVETAGKLGVLSRLWQFGATTDVSRGELEEEIQAAIRRLDLFEREPGEFAHWEGGQGSVSYTRMMRRHLLELAKLPFPAGHALLQRMHEALARARESDFLDLERAVQIFADGRSSAGERKRALNHVLKTAVLERERLVWGVGRHLSSQASQTCFALGLLRLSGTQSLMAKVDQRQKYTPIELRWWERLLATLGLRRDTEWKLDSENRRLIREPFWRGLNDMVAYMPYGQLYGMSATCDLLGLLTTMKADWQPAMIRFLDNGATSVVEGDIDTRSRPFEVFRNRAILVNYYDEEEVATLGSGEIEVSTRVSASTVELDDLFPIRVSFSTRTKLTTPVLEMVVPGHLYPMHHEDLSGGEDLRWELPLKDRSDVEIHFCAIRRGRAAIRFRITDRFEGGAGGGCERRIEVK